jgi:hypothetical protein
MTLEQAATIVCSMAEGWYGQNPDRNHPDQVAAIQMVAAHFTDDHRLNLDGEGFSAAELEENECKHYCATTRWKDSEDGELKRETRCDDCGEVIDIGLGG